MREIRFTRRSTPPHPKGEPVLIKNIFYYLVIFSTLMMTIGGSVSAFMAVADLVSPPPYYQSYESFREMVLAGKHADEETPPTEEAIRERYDRIVQEERQQTQARAVNRLIKSLGWIVIPLPVFLYFQRRVKAQG